MRGQSTATASTCLCCRRTGCCCRRPQPTLADHPVFAFRREGIDLAVLDALFARVSAAKVAEVVRAQPTGAFSRRLRFF